MSPLLVTIAAFVGVTALVGGVAMLLWGDGDEKLENRLSQLASGREAPEKWQLLKDGVLDESKNTHSLMEQVSEKLSRFNLVFQQADTSLDAGKFVVICGGLAVVGGATVAFAKLHPALIFPAAICAGLLPLLWLVWRRKRRLSKFESQLPDAMELVARALRSGHSLAAGFQLVGQEMSQPLGKEFAQVFEEQNFGLSLDESLQAIVDRVPLVDLKFFCTAVILQRQTGGDLAEILDKIGRLVRERFQIRGQINALTGEGRLSGVVLLALPPVLMAVVYYLNPEYINILFKYEMGQIMLFTAAVMQIIGAFFIKKIVSIKV
ncbi:MAG: type II secretion system F family protein [Pirellulales bacterium]